MTEKETRNFALRDKDGNEIGVFTGKQPRQAALKAANRGYTDIRLRERGTKKVHIFTGERKQVKKPKGCASLDASQDLEAKCKKGWSRETGKSRNHYFKGRRCQASQVNVQMRIPNKRQVMLGLNTI